MYPEGFHPIQRDLLPDYSRIVKPLPRSEATPKYYYTSFDVSVLISSDVVGVDPIESQTTPPPELAAFRVDISAMGTLLEKEFFEVRVLTGSHVKLSSYDITAAVRKLRIPLASHPFDG